MDVDAAAAADGSHLPAQRDHLAAVLDAEKRCIHDDPPV
jgi:hypothetical protein